MKSDYEKERKREVKDRQQVNSPQTTGNKTEVRDLCF